MKEEVMDEKEKEEEKEGKLRPRVGQVGGEVKPGVAIVSLVGT